MEHIPKLETPNENPDIENVEEKAPEPTTVFQNVIGIAVNSTVDMPN